MRHVQATDNKRGKTWGKQKGEDRNVEIRTFSSISPAHTDVGFEKRVYKLVDVHTRASTYARYVHDGDWVMGDLARAIR